MLFRSTNHTHFKHCLHFIYKRVSKKIISSTKKNIINKNLSYNKTILILSYEESSIYKSPFESMLSEICSQSIIPSLRSLFQTIASSLQLVDIIWSVRINKTLWLFNIYLFLQHPIQESTLDIHLIQLEIQMACYGQKYPNGF